MRFRRTGVAAWAVACLTVAACAGNGGPVEVARERPSSDPGGEAISSGVPEPWQDQTEGHSTPPEDDTAPPFSPQPAPEPPDIAATPAPAGWQEVVAGGALVAVPGDWAVEQVGSVDQPDCFESSVVMLVDAWETPWICAWVPAGSAGHDDPVVAAGPAALWDAVAFQTPVAETRLHGWQAQYYREAFRWDSGCVDLDCVSSGSADFEHWRVPELDLYLLVRRDTDPELAEQIVAAVTPQG